MVAKVEENKPFWKSKTKMGALLVGLGAVLGTIGGVVAGDLSLMVGLQSLAAEVGIVIGIMGLRDIPLLNKLK